MYFRTVRARHLWAPLVLAIAADATALTYQQALDNALASAPSLEATSAAIAAARQLEIPAGALPDPQLSLGINNLPIEGADRFSTSTDMMTMRQIGIMQAFPNRAKRMARAAVARHELAEREQEQELARIEAQTNTATAWLMLYHLNLQQQILDQWEEENQMLAQTVAARLNANQGLVTESVLPRQEAALLEERRDLLVRDAHHARAQLQQWLGELANQPLSGVPPTWQLATEKTLVEALERHPALHIYEPRSKKLAAELDEARADKRPDWAVEMMYGQRRAPMAEDMISVKFTVDLPIFGARRQDPRIAAKLAQQDQLSAEREVQARELAAILSAELANYQQLERAWQRQKAVLLPLSEEKVQLATSAWRANRLPLSELMAARRERLDAQLRLRELAAERDLAAALLHLSFQAPQLSHPATQGAPAHE
ncbi:MAG TPA: TolC family protein [Cellvibrio sp.]|nr:TolC family protein [Cellvibrio sp.]